MHGVEYALHPAFTVAAVRARVPDAGRPE